MMRIRTQVSCVAVRDNQVALIERLDKSDPTLYHRMLPPGGHVEFGETLEEACIREMHEETGLTVADLQLKGIVQFISRSDDDYHSVCFFFVTSNVTGEICNNNPDESEKLEAHWIPLGDVEASPSITDYHKAIIKHLLNEKGLMNAVVEWNSPGDELEWRIVSERPVMAR